MTYMSLSYLDDELAPSIYSLGPEVDDEGDVRSPTIVLSPWGEPDRFSAQFFLSVEEAEEIARMLLEYILAAKEGIYSDYLEDLPNYRMKFAFDQAWRSLGLSTKPPDRARDT